MNATVAARTAVRALVLGGLCAAAVTAEAGDAQSCTNPIYLAVDPGHMDFAPRIAEVLRRQQVKATFFVSNQSTRNGGGSLGDQWGSWWKVVADQGHDFVSQTYDHIAWRGDLPGYKSAFRIKPGAGAFEGREFTFDPPKYCDQITHAADRIAYFTGKKALPLFHAPTGNISPKLMAAASACGFAHVGIAAGAWLANGVSLKSALSEIRNGGVLLVDLKASATTEPWAVSNLEPLIVGLKQRGMCFESLRKHPAYRDWIASHGG
jgi:peptidoglycan/xylan/chitin deacetylase (PgdA/CDA1 family)